MTLSFTLGFGHFCSNFRCNTSSDAEWKAFQANMPAQTIPRVKEKAPHDEWINALKGTGPKPGSDFEYGASLTEMALIGVLAQRFNTKIEYDAINMKVTNHPELAPFIRETARQGWVYGRTFGNYCLSFKHHHKK